MSIWLYLAIAIVAIVLVAIVAMVVILRRSGMTAAEGTTYLRELGVDLKKLPGRLWRVANDPRTPRRAKIWLALLALYILSPIDPIPDFLPVIGYLDEIILVPLILRHIRRMIPDKVWDEHFGTSQPTETA